MSDNIAKVIKAGNSYALRVPKAYIKANRLRLGQRVILPQPPMTETTHDPQALVEAIKRLQAIVKANKTGLNAINDPSAWQDEIRKTTPLPGRE